MTRIITFFKRYPVVAATLVVGLAAGVLLGLGQPGVSRLIITLYAGAFAAWSAYDMVRDMLRGHFGLDVLALVAIISTLAVGEQWASLVVVLMLSGGEALEDFAAGRARSELTALLDRSPTVAHVLSGNQDDQSATVDVDVDTVEVGDLLLVRPAEVVPVDCELMSEFGTFDQSSITGESLPVTLKTGDEIPSGSTNGSSSVIVRTLHRSADSQYQQIIRLVQESEKSKAPVVRLADRFAVPFTIISVVIAGVAWAISGDPVRFAEVLVLATPCPLLIAAPVAFMGGMSRSAQAGIIVKGGAVLEQAARVKAVAFDKTGTLTRGKPEVIELRPAAGFTPEVLLRLAASAEQYSSHVLADGIRKAADEQGIALLPVQAAHETNADGITADSDEGLLTVGRFEFVAAAAPQTDGFEPLPGQVVVHVAQNADYIGAVILSDEVRPESAAVVEWLGNNGVEQVAMLTGDGPRTAALVAQQVGITHVNASLRPEQKVQVMAELQPRPTMMVGDGINDAPVLVASDIGVAMGARGSTAAGEAADAVILKDSLSRLPALISISRDTLKVALTAIWIGIVLSIALMLVATTGAIPAIVGAGLQEVLDLVTILYALRALTGRLPEIGQVAAPTKARSGATTAA